MPGTATLIRRGSVWAAGQPQRTVVPRVAAPANVAAQAAPEGRFGAALDPRAGSAQAAAQATIYDRRPLTVECWAKLNGKAGFNILVANNSKESAEHWELYSYAGSGDLSLYLPGFAPAEIRSGVDITDGQWHYVAATFDETQASLYVDGKLVKQTAIARARSGGPTDQLYFGGYPPHSIGCDGLVDEVRISKALRAIRQRARRRRSRPTKRRSACGTSIAWSRGRSKTLRPNKNPAVAERAQRRRRTAADAATWRTRQLKLITIDTSPDESFLSIRADTTGRLFVGGREALFVYEPDARADTSRGSCSIAFRPTLGSPTSRFAATICT